MRAVVLALLCSSTSAFIPSAVVKKLSNSRIQSTEEAAAALEEAREKGREEGREECAQAIQLLVDRRKIL